MKFHLNNLVVLGTILMLTGGAQLGCQSAPSPDPPSSDRSSPVQRPAPVPAVDTGREAERRAVKTIEVEIDEFRQVLRSCDEAFKKNAYADIAEHSDQLVELAKQIRRQTIDLSENDAEFVRLLIDRIQHASHEMEDAAERGDHEGTHHALGNLTEEFETLKDRVKSM